MSSFFQRLSAIVLAGSAVASLPFFASLSQLQPPWPPAAAELSIIVIVVVAAFMWFVTEYGRASGKEVTRRNVVVLLCVSTAGLAAYLILWSLFVEAVPSEDRSLVRGFVCNQESLRLYGNQCPHLPVRMIEDAGWNARKVWEGWSVTIVEFGLLATWVMFLGGLMGLIGLIAGRVRKTPAVPINPAG